MGRGEGPLMGPIGQDRTYRRSRTYRTYKTYRTYRTLRTYKTDRLPAAGGDRTPPRPIRPILSYKSNMSYRSYFLLLVLSATWDRLSYFASFRLPFLL